MNVRRPILLLAALGAASVLAACGGSSGGEEKTARRADVPADSVALVDGTPILKKRLDRPDQRSALASLQGAAAGCPEGRQRRPYELPQAAGRPDPVPARSSSSPRPRKQGVKVDSAKVADGAEELEDAVAGQGRRVAEAAQGLAGATEADHTDTVRRPAARAGPVRQAHEAVRRPSPTPRSRRSTTRTRRPLQGAPRPQGRAHPVRLAADGSTSAPRTWRSTRRPTRCHRAGSTKGDDFGELAKSTRSTRAKDSEQGSRRRQGHRFDPRLRRRPPSRWTPARSRRSRSSPSSATTSSRRSPTTKHAPSAGRGQGRRSRQQLEEARPRTSPSPTGSRAPEPVREARPRSRPATACRRTTDGHRTPVPTDSGATAPAATDGLVTQDRVRWAPADPRDSARGPCACSGPVARPTSGRRPTSSARAGRARRRARPGAAVVAAPDVAAWALALAEPERATWPEREQLEANAAAGALAELWRVTLRLRRDCPWDREQTTPRSCRTPSRRPTRSPTRRSPAGPSPKLLDELGDLLFQTYFLALLARRRARATWPTSRAASATKLRAPPPARVRRRGARRAAGDVRDRWEDVKRESEGREGIFHDVPRALPALLEARKVQRRAAAIGFDWDAVRRAWPAIAEEMRRAGGELGAEPERRASSPRRDVLHETGDVLFACVNVLRLAQLRSRARAARRDRAASASASSARSARRRRGRDFRLLGLDEQETTIDAPSVLCREGTSDIDRIRARRQILDSRGQPDRRGRGRARRGRARPRRGALGRLDGPARGGRAARRRHARYGGKGVARRVANVNGEIAAATDRAATRSTSAAIDDVLLRARRHAEQGPARRQRDPRRLAGRRARRGRRARACRCTATSAASARARPAGADDERHQRRRARRQLASTCRSSWSCRSARRRSPRRCAWASRSTTR